MDAVAGLETWLAPFLAVLGRTTLRTLAPHYVQGLLGPGEAKNVQLIASRLGLRGHDAVSLILQRP